MTVFTTFWWLLCAHALTDYVLQPERMAELKSPWAGHHNDYGPWWWWMIAHGLVNALGVLYVTQNVWLSVGEFVVHTALDIAKCYRWINTNTDQVGHLISKVVWSL